MAKNPSKNKIEQDEAPELTVEQRVAELELTVTALQKQLRGHRHDPQNADCVVLQEEQAQETETAPPPAATDAEVKGGNQ